MAQESRTETVPVSRSVVQRFRLAVVGGGDRSHLSQGERALVGTHESVDLVLDDPTVSRFHCEIDVAGGRPRVRDLGSKNGTVVDGVQVVEAFLRDGSVLTLGRALVRFSLEAEPVEIPLATRGQFGTLVGRSTAMRAVFHVLERAAGSAATVLLTGEMGTGKDAAVESLHREGPRAEGPLVVVDCAAIPPAQLEGELFGAPGGGHEGALAAAEGGTLFLDEVAELTAELQAKLLRVLERRQLRGVPVDVRVVAATNRDLRAEVNAARFRADLYYRLAVVEVRLPALRERTEDLAPLVERFLEELPRTDPTAVAGLLAPEFLERLAAHPWPGNVRELRSYLERCLALREQVPFEAIEGPAQALVADARRPLKEERVRWTQRLERSYLEACLRMHEGNVTVAARAAGVDRIHFYRLLWRHGLR